MELGDLNSLLHYLSSMNDLYHGESVGKQSPSGARDVGQCKKKKKAMSFYILFN